MSKYLDFNGLAHYNDIITPAINNITEGTDKNYIELDAVGKTRTLNEVTATINSDNSVTISGKNTSSNNFILIYDLSDFTKGGSTVFTVHKSIPINEEYICIGSQSSKVVVQVLSFNSDSDYELLSNSSLDTTFIPTKTYITFRIWIKGNADFTTPITIYPQVYRTSTYKVNKTVRPFTYNNQEITEIIKNPLSTADIDEIWIST